MSMMAAQTSTNQIYRIAKVCSYALSGGLIWLMLLTSVRAEPVLSPHTASYYLKRDDISLGTATRTLRAVEKGVYLLETSSQATGFLSLFIRGRIEESSKWTYHDAHIRPLEYSYQRGSGDKRKFTTMVFDWEHYVVNGNNNNGPWRLPIPSEVSDKLSYQLSLMLDLQAGKKTLQYVLADGDKLKDYKFEILGEEQLATAIGQLHTVKIRRIDDVRKTTVWCASKLNYFPVRLDQTEKDGVDLSMQIKSYKSLPDKPAP